MKKIFGALMIAVCMGMAMPAQAQLHFGVKGGLNLSKVSFSKNDFKGDNKTGFFIGPMAEFTLPIVGIGIDAAALYSQTEMKVEGMQPGVKLKTFEVPVNLKWSFGLGSMLGLYVAAGPQFGFNVGNKNIQSFELKKSNTSFNVGAGVKLIRHIQLGVNYNFALGHTGVLEETLYGTDRGEISKMKNNNWQVSVAYLF